MQIICVDESLYTFLPVCAMPAAGLVRAGLPELVSERANEDTAH